MISFLGSRKCKKGITPVVATILLLMITISITGVSFVFLQRSVQTSAQSTEQQLSNQAGQMANAFSIEGVDKNIVYIKNVGAKSLNTSVLNFYVNNVLVESSSIIIASGTISAVALNDSKLAMLPDPAELKVTSASFSDKITADFYGKYTVGYWKLDEASGNIAKDSSGNGNDGNLLPAGSGPQWVAGKSGNALQFDGVNDYVNLDDIDQIANEASMSLEAWFKTNSINTEQVVIGGRDENALAGRSLLIQTTGTGSIFSQTTGDNSGVTGNTALVAGVWYHAVAVVNGQNLKVYLNGRLDGENTLTPITDISFDSTRIGSTTIGTQWLNGVIDEVRILNVARSMTIS